MALNNNQKAIRKGYAEIAKALGSTMNVYRPSEYIFAPTLDPRNWLFEIPFSASKGSGFQTTQMFGVPTQQGFFDSTDIVAGDVFSDGVRTFYVGDIPLFEPPMVIECFNTFTCTKPIWDKATRSHAHTVCANEIPCNIQSSSDKLFDRDGQSFSNPDAQQTWTIKTWLPDGLISTNDVITFDSGIKTQVVDTFRTQHGLSIRVTEILGDKYTNVG